MSLTAVPIVSPAVVNLLPPVVPVRRASLSNHKSQETQKIKSPTELL